MKKFFFLFILINVLITSQAQTPSGLSMYFDGEDDYIRFRDRRIDTLPNITLEAWIKPCDVDSSSNVIYTKTWCGALSSYNFIVRPGGALFFSYDLNGVCGPSSSQAFTNTDYVVPGTWQHIAVVHSADSGITRFFYNGVRITQSDVTLNGTFFPLALSEEPLRVGVYRSASNNYSSGAFKGNMDECRLWNYGRTDNEILNAYNTSLSGNENGLLVYFSMEEPLMGITKTVINHANNELKNGTTRSASNINNDISPFTISNSLDICCSATTAASNSLRIKSTTLFDHSFEYQPKEEKLKVIPNPSAGEVTLEWQGEKGAAGNLSILNMAGKEMFKTKVLNHSKITLPTKLEGVYIVNIITEERVFSSKIVMQ